MTTVVPGKKTSSCTSHHIPLLVCDQLTSPPLPGSLPGLLNALIQLQGHSSSAPHPRAGLGHWPFLAGVSYPTEKPWEVATAGPLPLTRPRGPEAQFSV